MRRRFTVSTLALGVISSLVLVSTVLVSTVLVNTGLAATRIEVARDGVRYLIGRQHPNGSFPGFSPLGSTADAALAMSTAGRGRAQIDEALGYLARKVGEATLGQKAKIVLAAVAAGKDLSRYAGGDLVSELQATQREDGQYASEGDFSAVTTHALVSLALAAAGEPINDPAADWLAAAQCPDGGWQYDEAHQPGEDEHCFDATKDAEGNPVDFSTSDSNTTSYAVQALATHSHEVQLTADPFDYFPLTKDPVKGGYRYSHEDMQFGSPSYTDANSTALVIQAYLTCDTCDFSPPLHALKDLEYARCGALQGAFAFTWQDVDGKLRRLPSKAEARAEKSNDGSTVAGATIGAIPGLMLEPLPVAPQLVKRGAPDRRRCA